MRELGRDKLLRRLKKGAIQAAIVAGKYQAKHFGKKLRVDEKPGAGLVTNVDTASEEKAIRILKRIAPRFSFLAEESGTSATTRAAATAHEGRWIIDPLDGTTNFVHGFPMFCVSIAAELAGELVVGVIYHPILKELYVAVKDQGATVNGRTIRVSKTETIADSVLTTGFTVQKEKWLKAEIEAFARLSRIARAVRRPGSAALDLAYTSRGVFDGFWERNLSPWDVAAGAILVQEAGGIVTDFRGGPFSLEGREILASSALLHEPLKSLLSPESCPVN